MADEMAAPAALKMSGSMAPQFARYKSRLQRLDKNGDGQLDVEEIVESVTQLLEAERQRTFFKWGAILAGVIAVLAVAASTGLTYAMVALNKDTKVTNTYVLVDKSTGQPLQAQSSEIAVDPQTGALVVRGSDAGPVATTTTIQKARLTSWVETLYSGNGSAAEVQHQLASLRALIIADAEPGAPYAVWQVGEVALLGEGGLQVSSLAGSMATFLADGTTTVEGPGGLGRRTLGARSNGTTIAILEGRVTRVSDDARRRRRQ